MTGTPDSAGEPTEEITAAEVAPVELAWRTGALRLVWVAVRDSGDAQTVELGVDLSEVVMVSALGGGVHLVRSFAEGAQFWCWSPQQARAHAQEALGRADVRLAVALAGAATLAEETAW